MELDELGFLEELMALRGETWDTLPNGMSEFFSSEGSLDCFQESQGLVPPSFSAFEGLAAAPADPNFDCLSEVYCLFGAGFAAAAPEIQPSSVQSALEDGKVGPVNGDHRHGVVGDGQTVCKVEMGQSAEASVVLGMGGCMDRKRRRAEGLQSKNLMAERRRRKRLNDRLSMLRSIVPKISKMDRTSILSDTIDYMKELLERIQRLQEEMEVGSEQPNLLGIFKEQLNPNDILVRNSPKFDVERRDSDTRIEICCTAKTGLLLSTVNTLEALGLEIQQCVISCFNDFGMQASCSEDMEQRAVISSEEIKQVMFRTAGYGGRCL